MEQNEVIHLHFSLKINKTDKFLKCCFFFAWKGKEAVPQCPTS